jgi:GDP-D-mannose dehydratase
MVKKTLTTRITGQVGSCLPELPLSNWPAEMDLLICHYSKAKQQRGWGPKFRFVDLVKLMADANLNLPGRHCQSQIQVSN